MKKILIFLPLLALLALPACEPTGDDGVDAVQLGVVVATLPNRPNLRITNSSGGTQTLSFYTSSSCTGTASATFTNVATGTTSSYSTIDAGTYYVSIGGVGCSTQGFSFTMGTTINQSNNTCTSSSAVVAGVTCAKTN